MTAITVETIVSAFKMAKERGWKPAVGTAIKMDKKECCAIGALALAARDFDTDSFKPYSYDPYSIVESTYGLSNLGGLYTGFDIGWVDSNAVVKPELRVGFEAAQKVRKLYRD